MNSAIKKYKILLSCTASVAVILSALLLTVPADSGAGPRNTCVYELVYGNEFREALVRGGGNATQLSDEVYINQRYSWSPDGRRIAYVQDGEGHASPQIFKVDLNGNRTQLTNNFGSKGEVAWSPDGRNLAFYAGNREVEGIYVMDLNGNNRRMVHESRLMMGPAWAPDSRMLVGNIHIQGFLPPYFYIYMLDTSGQQEPRLLKRNSFSTKHQFSPDGSTLFYDGYLMSPGSPPPGPPASVEPVIQGMAIDGGFTRRRTFSEHDSDFDLSPDGNKLAFVSQRDGNKEIYITDSDSRNGDNEIRLTDNPAADSSPTWSSDGRTLAFVSDRDGNKEIYAVNVGDPESQINLTRNPAIDDKPIWSPDGEKIAFMSSRGDRDRSLNVKIFVINAPSIQNRREIVGANRNCIPRFINKDRLPERLQPEPRPRPKPGPGPIPWATHDQTRIRGLKTHTRAARTFQPTQRSVSRGEIQTVPFSIDLEWERVS